MSPHAKRYLLGFAFLLTAAALGLSLGAARRFQPSAQETLASVLRHARETGSYAFSTDLTQVTVPVSKVTNVGRSSRTVALHMEGQTNMDDHSMQMRLWTDQGSVEDPSSGMAVKVEEGRTYVQQGLGAWREQDGLTDAFAAPQGDLMAFLTALRDPVASPPETSHGIRYQRYTFRLDGPALAVYMRNQAEAELRRRGELPNNLQMETPAYYRDSSGDGEVWVGSDGLPLRQILRIQFPEQDGETVYAEITTTFSQYGLGTGTPAASGLAGGYFDLLGGWQTLAALLLVAAFCGLLLIRGRRIWRGLAPVIIVTLILNPLLGDMKVASAISRSNERTEEQEQQREESRLREELLARMAEPQVDPHADPLAAANTTGRGNPPAALPASFLAGPQVAPPQQGIDEITCPDIPSPLDPNDIDGDTLTNHDEATLGTSPCNPDTDDDGIADGTEVKGFKLSPLGQTWYMDANAVDSNSDGISDTEEFDFNNDNQPDDTDGDQVPDVFDPDNDGDGMPDNKDAAPFTNLSQTFTDQDPLILNIQNLTAAMPTFVDFQIRPANPDQLWFAYNVLDWPKDDREGHVQDVDGLTFGNLPFQSGDPAPEASEYYGDMKLVPMLEIRMPDSGVNMPQAADYADELDPYNISVNPTYTADGSVWVAYVPLSIVTDEQTGDRLAFNARMRYKPAASGISGHEVRLVWMVEVLNDLICDPIDATDPECQGDGYIHNRRQVVHSYVENWELVGLNLKEDHGASVAIIYEDPVLDTNPERNQNEVLTALSAGLDQSFLAARDQDGNNSLDVDLAEIDRRFNYPAECSGNECWSLPDILRVEREGLDYQTVDQAIADTVSTKTKSILDTHFKAIWAAEPEAGRKVKPLLMYAQETRSRALGLDARASMDGSVNVNGSSLTFDLNPGGSQAPVLVTNSLKWTPYCGSGTGAEVSWSPCETGEWWGTLEDFNDGTLPGEGEPNDPQMRGGRIMALELYSSILSQGISMVVKQGEAILSPPSGYEVQTDQTMSSKNSMWLLVPQKASMVITNEVLMARYKHITVKQQFTRHLGDLRISLTKMSASVADIFRNFKTAGFGNAAKAFGIAAGVFVVLSCVVFAVADLALDTSTPLGIIGTAVLEIAFTALMQIYLPIKSAINWIQNVRVSNLPLKVGSMRSEVVGNSRIAGAIGAIIAGLITWGFFIYSMVSDHVSPFGLEFNRALANAIAETIYIIMMVFLAATVIGGIIAGVIAIFDILATMICKLTGHEKSCFTIGGFATKLIAWFLYSSAPMINTDYKDLLVMGYPALTLADEGKGYSAGNGMTVTLPVTTNIYHKQPRLWEGYHIFYYPWLFSEDNLTSTTFNYSLTRSGGETLPASRGTMADEWQTSAWDGHKFVGVQLYRGSANTTLSRDGYVLQAGLNQSLPFYFNLGYAIPVYECWQIPFLFFLSPPYCRVRTLSGSDSKLINSLVVDVFPATLDGFTELQSRGAGGYALKWDSRFPVLKDADGDGLRGDGLDPNDSLWDTDLDGLSDRFEVEERSKGKGFDPAKCDIDGDGLSDMQEALLGTAPDRADTDNDGLDDGLEVVHQRLDPATYPDTCQLISETDGGWEITADFGTLRVQSNPLMPDTDGDGIDDYNEYTHREDLDYKGYRYHPQVPNEPWARVYGEASASFVNPGGSLTYTSTVISKFTVDSMPLTVTLPFSLGGIQENYTVPIDPVSLSGSQVTPVTARTDAVTQPASINSMISFNYPPETGITEVNHSLTIYIDADKPSSQIDSPVAAEWSRVAYVKGDFGGIVHIIGGKASDALSGVAKVQVSINNGGWQDATGAESWSFPLAVTSGRYLVRSRAIDVAGNIEDPGEGIWVYADARPPEFIIEDQTGMPQVPGREASGIWTVDIRGTFYDPDIEPGDYPGMYPGSGFVESTFQLRLHLIGQDPPVTGEWQQGSANYYGEWSTSYRLPESVVDPTGVWQVEMRVNDVVGNVGQVRWMDAFLLIDSAAPQPILSEQDAARTSMNQGTEIGGTITEALSGVDRLEAAFAPLNQVEPLGDAVLWLSFDEPASSNYFPDRSGHGGSAYCTLTYFIGSCQAGQPGRMDGGLAFELNDNGYDRAIVSHKPELNIAAGEGFSLQAWAKIDRSDPVVQIAPVQIVQKEGVYLLHMDNTGRVRWTVNTSQGTVEVTSSAAIAYNEWHHLVATIDSAAGKIQLYVDGALAGENSIPAGGEYASDAPVLIGTTTYYNYDYGFGYYYGTTLVVDEVVITKHALTQAEVTAMKESASRVWHPAVLSQHGADVSQATWSLSLPPGLEGSYQIDLRGWDVLGNHAITADTWRGIIDTTAPRLELTAVSTGAVNIDPATTQRRVGVQYHCSAVDTYLDETTLQCPGSSPRLFERSFFTDPILSSVFPDLTLREGLASGWTQWQPAGPFTASTQACDQWGNCATLTKDFNVDVLPGVGPSAAVIVPANQAMVASDGNFTVTVSANAPAGLKTITLALDGHIVDTASFPQGSAPTINQRTLTLTAAEGSHTLLALATDWAGAAQGSSYPVSFTLDTHPPAVDITTPKVTLADVYQKGSPALRFHGTASDTVCLAAVQLSVNGGPFLDANFGNGEWAAAYYVNAPEGKTLTVAARATDCAGQTSQKTVLISTDLSAPDAPETTLTMTPGNPSLPSATFGFTATGRGKPVYGFMCQVDDGLYTPCAAPYTLNGLSQGQHIFRVRAVNVEGSVDETPASFSWKVVGQIIYLPLLSR